MNEVKDEEQLHTYETLKADRGEGLVIAVDGIRDDQEALDALYEALNGDIKACEFKRTILTAMQTAIRGQV